MSSDRLRRGKPTHDADDIPEVLYHYTSTSGLLGILSSMTVWATDLRYLNDSTELEFGLKQMLTFFDKMALPKREDPSLVDELALLYQIPDWSPLVSEHGRYDESTHAVRAVAAARAVLAAFPSASTFGVACFCRHGDLLSQWRGYGANGYAIGFDALKLRNLVAKRYLPLSGVSYGRMGGGQLVLTMRREVHEILGARASEDSTRVRDKMTLHLLRLAAKQKDTAFMEEGEWRLGDLARVDDEALHFREGSLGIVPYLEIPLAAGDELLPIVEIRIAPGPDVSLRIAAAESLLSHHGYREGAVRVEASQIPFRGR